MRFWHAVLIGIVGSCMMTKVATAQNWCGENRRFNDAERAICDDTSIGQLDAIMSSDYFALRNRLSRSERKRLKAHQRAWKADRDACGYSPDCIRSVYQTRIGQLRIGQLEWSQMPEAPSEDERLEEQAARNRELRVCVERCEKNKAPADARKCDSLCRELLNCSIGRSNC